MTVVKRSGADEEMFTFAEPTEWWLEISPTAQAVAWQQSLLHSTSSSRWNAYLNQLSLDVLLPWLQTEYASQTDISLDSTAASAIWEFVNGIAIAIGAIRLILIPAETIDSAELEVPQEWVDIPSWAGNYYLAIQLKLDEQSDEQWIRVWGYLTHQELKDHGEYDPSDRTYCVSTENLSRDMNTFWVTCQFCPEEPTQAAIAPIPELTSVQAANLIERLGNASVAFPRLAVPFALWGALLERDEWRQRLYEQRIQQDQTVDVVVSLSQWLRGQFSAAWQIVEEVLPPQQLAAAWRTRNELQQSDRLQNPVFDVNRVKVLNFGTQASSEQIALLIGVTPVSATEVNIGVQICPVGDRSYLPREVQVRLLDETQTEIGQASAAVTETIQLQFGGRQGESFSLEVRCGDESITEAFLI